VDLGAPIDDRTLALLRDVDGVMSAAPTADGTHLRVRDRDVLAVVVATLVGREVPVYSAIPRAPTLEDVYFAIEEKFT
ncbi:MAG: type transport system ATP-binding protein, partial [Acidimicrobiaceae bacterium]